MLIYTAFYKVLSLLFVIKKHLQIKKQKIIKFVKINEN